MISKVFNKYPLGKRPNFLQSNHLDYTKIFLFLKIWSNIKMNIMLWRNTFYPSGLNLALKSFSVPHHKVLRHHFTLWKNPLNGVLMTRQRISKLTLQRPLTEVSRMFYNDPAYHKPFEIFHHKMFWTWPERKMWTVASTLNRTKNYCFRLLSLIAENNATQNLDYQSNLKSPGSKNELISTVKMNW